VQVHIYTYTILTAIFVLASCLLDSQSPVIVMLTSSQGRL